MDEQEKKLEEQAPDTEQQPEPQEDQSETVKETTEKIWGSTKHAWSTATFKANQYKKLVQKKIDLSRQEQVRLQEVQTRCPKNQPQNYLLCQLLHPHW